MIAYLRGLVISRAEHYIVLDVQGVGYRVFTTPQHARSVAHGDEVQLHIHTHVREDTLQLFGFGVEVERGIFLALCDVKGIGPKLGMTILGGASTADLLALVGRGDVKALTKIKGLGKKTAERMVVELSKKFASMAPVASIVGARSPSASTPTGILADVASALGNLGFKPAQIDKALDALRAMDGAPEDFESLFREAMKNVR